jgi:hypothetical protein
MMTGARRMAYAAPVGTRTFTGDCRTICNRLSNRLVAIGRHADALLNLPEAARTHPPGERR